MAGRDRDVSGGEGQDRLTLAKAWIMTIFTVPHFLIEFDRSIFLALNHGMKSQFLDAIMPALTDIGLGYIQVIAVVLTAVYLEINTGEIYWGASWKSLPRAIRTHRSWTGPLLVAVLIGGIGSGIIKSAIPGDRPWWYYENEHKAGRHLSVQVLTVEGVYPVKVRRFPSGHTTTSVAMAWVVSMLWRRRHVGLWVSILLWFGAAVVALSRIYLASHWPLDILGGALLGAVSGYAAVRVCEVWAVRHATNTLTKVGDGTDLAQAVCLPTAAMGAPVH